MTDAVYNIFRWYRPGWGQYTQIDPLYSVSSAYEYANHRPLNVIDHLGLTPITTDKYPVPNSEIEKKCGAPGLGCATLLASFKCDCKQDGCGKWKPNAWMVVDKINVYYSTDCTTPADKVLAQEMLHVKDYEANIDEANKELSKWKAASAWDTKGACDLNCILEKNYLENIMSKRKWTVDHFKHPWKNCNGGFSPPSPF